MPARQETMRKILHRQRVVLHGQRLPQMPDMHDAGEVQGDREEAVREVLHFQTVVLYFQGLPPVLGVQSLGAV